MQDFSGTQRFKRAAFTGAALAALLVSGTASAQTAGESQPLELAGVNDEIERFCGNIADAARDRRYVIQTQELEALKAEIDLRVKNLDAKRAEYEEWMKLRQEFMRQASENVVSIYSRMRPDAAAERLASMETGLAAAILMKLEVKRSGQIMNEMERTVAARLTGIMASTARAKDPT